MNCSYNELLNIFLLSNFHNWPFNHSTSKLDIKHLFPSTHYLLICMFYYRFWRKNTLFLWFSNMYIEHSNCCSFIYLTLCICNHVKFSTALKWDFSFILVDPWLLKAFSPSSSHSWQASPWVNWRLWLKQRFLLMTPPPKHEN